MTAERDALSLVQMALEQHRDGPKVAAMRTAGNGPTIREVIARALAAPPSACSSEPVVRECPWHKGRSVEDCDLCQQELADEAHRIARRGRLTACRIEDVKPEDLPFPPHADYSCWLLEHKDTDLCVGMSGSDFRWVAFTDERALQFARKADAEAIKRVLPRELREGTVPRDHMFCEPHRACGVCDSCRGEGRWVQELGGRRWSCPRCTPPREGGS